MAIYGSCGRRFVFACALLCLVSSSEVQMLDDKEQTAAKKEAPAEENPLQHGNTLQTPDQRYKDAKKGSLSKPADPGYGQASASRTDMQRAHEAEEEKRLELQAQGTSTDPLEPAGKADARKMERAMYRRINSAAWRAKGPSQISRSQSNVENIKRKAEKVKHKMQQAVKAVRDQMFAAGKDAAQAEAAEPPSEKPTKEQRRREAIKAEMDQLRAEDHKDVHHASGHNLFQKGDKLATHKSGNWADKTRTASGRHYRPKNHKDPASYRNPGDTPEEQKKP